MNAFIGLAYIVGPNPSRIDNATSLDLEWITAEWLNKCTSRFACFVVQNINNWTLVGDSGTMLCSGASNGDAKSRIICRSVVVQVRRRHSVCINSWQVQVCLVSLKSLMQFPDAPTTCEVVHP